MEYTSNREDKRFTVNDIWYSDYTVENVQQIFSKPNPTQKASNEYDKYFGQPIKLLDAAGVIHGEKSGRGYTYSIVNQELLTSYVYILKKFLKIVDFIEYLNTFSGYRIKTVLEN